MAARGGLIDGNHWNELHSLARRLATALCPRNRGERRAAEGTNASAAPSACRARRRIRTLAPVLPNGQSGADSNNERYHARPGVLWHYRQILAAILMVAITTSAAAVGAQDPTQQEVPQNPTCSIQRGHVVADFVIGRYAPIFSMVFRVFDQERRQILTEIVPVTTTDSIFRVDDEPLNDGGLMTRAAKVSCYATRLIGSSATPTNPLCRSPVPVDMGISALIRAIEVVGSRVVVQVTAQMTALGVIQIQNFQGDSLYLRSSSKGGTTIARVPLRGPNPATITIAGALPPDATDALEVGVDEDTPLVAICLGHSGA